MLVCVGVRKAVFVPTQLGIPQEGTLRDCPSVTVRSFLFVPDYLQVGEYIVYFGVCVAHHVESIGYPRVCGPISWTKLTSFSGKGKDAGAYDVEKSFEGCSVWSVRWLSVWMG